MRKTALALALALLLTGCAGGGSRGPAAEPPEETRPTPEPVSEASDKGMARSTPTPEPTPEPKEPYDFAQTVPEGEAVEEDYFADACFIGDSRTEGFKLWSGLTQGDYMANTGLMVFQVYKRDITFEGQEMKVLDALALKEYGKVYISLGVNELGMYNNQGYYDNYAKFLDDVKLVQPEAVIYVQLIIPVNTKKCEEAGQASYVNNEQIQVYNDLLRQLVQDKQVALLDPASVIVDETGEPPYEATADGVHFNRSGYQLWYEYLRTHTVEKGDLV